jgi:hypothetical protein
MSLIGGVRLNHPIAGTISSAALLRNTGAVTSLSSLLIDKVNANDGFVWLLDETTGSPPRTAQDASAQNNDGTDVYQLADINQPVNSGDRASSTSRKRADLSTGDEGVYINGTFGSYPWTIVTVQEYYGNQPTANPIVFGAGFDYTAFNQSNGNFSVDCSFVAPNARFRDPNGVFYSGNGSVLPWGRVQLNVFTMDASGNVDFWVDGVKVLDTTRTPQTPTDPDDFHVGSAPSGDSSVQGYVYLAAFIDGYLADQTFVNDLFATVVDPNDPTATYMMNHSTMDRFTDTNGTLLTAHTPDYQAVAESWNNGFGGVATITSNEAVHGGTARSASYIETNQHDLTRLEVEVSFKDTAPFAGFIFRYQDANNYFIAWRGNGGAYVEKYVGGVKSTVGFQNSSSRVSNDYRLVLCLGDNNEILFYTVSSDYIGNVPNNDRAIVNVTDATFSGNTLAGIYCDPRGGTQVGFTNFRVTPYNKAKN